MRRPTGRRHGRAASAGTPGAIAWATRLPEAELVDLVWDSGLDVGVPPLRVDREPADRCCPPRPAVRALVFVSAGLGIALEIGPPPGRRVRGRLAPARSGRLELHGTAWGPLEVAVDPAGRFALPGAPPGPARLVLRAPDGTVTATSWVLID